MKKIVIILIILCLFIPIVYVYSEDVILSGSASDGTGKQSDINFSSDSGDGATIFDPSTGSAKGIRFSLVNSYGTNYVSKDYIDGGYAGNVKVFDATGYNSRFIVDSGCSKIAYLSGSCDFNDPSSLKSIKVADISALEDLFMVDGFSASFIENIRSSVQSSLYSSIDIKDKPSGMTQEQYSDLLTDLFSGLTGRFLNRPLSDFASFSEKENEAPIVNLFLVFEPLYVVQINNELYMGTSYELANFAKKTETSSFGCDTAICALGAYLKKQMPCTSLLDGNLAKKMEQAGASFLLNHFSSSSYFNGAIKIDYNYSYNICSTSEIVVGKIDGVSRFTPEQVSGNLGIGMKVIWPSSVYLGDDDTPPTNPPSGNKFNCTPYYNVGTCINTEKIEYQDSIQAKDYITPEYWENCIFNKKGYYNIEPHKDSLKNQNDLTYYESGLGGKYCEVYCIETFSSNFPVGGFSVLAGQYFIWGNGSATGGRTCRTKSVNWSKFKSDLNTANNDIIESYANWKIEQNKEYALENNVKSAGDCGCVYNTENVSCCTNDQPVYSSCAGLTGAELSQCKANPPIVGYECESGKENNEKKPKYSVSWSGYTVNGKYYSGGSETWCEGDTKPSANVKGAGDQYSSALEKAQGVINEMRQCYNWSNDDKVGNIYTTNPSFTVSYSDTKYSYNGQLKTDIKYNQVADSSNNISYEDVPRVSYCSGNKCYYFDEPMKNGSQGYFEMTRTANINFSLQDNIFRYVIKGTNESKNVIPSSTPFTTNYYDMGFPNFPVAFSTPDGTYSTLNIHYEKLGHIKGSETTDVDTILFTIYKNAGETYNEWSCQFSVYSDLIPDPNNPNNPNNPNGSNGGPGDIRVVYRTIDLIDPFPDIDGSKRNTGSNWCDGNGNCSYNNYVVEKYINNNRGVSDYEMYSGDPMYTFILTPSIIKEIRRYNSTNSYASYTGSLDGKNYDYKCNTSKYTDGRYCVSDYLSYIINITGAKNEPGSCVADKYRNYNDTANFDACRY